MAGDIILIGGEGAELRLLAEALGGRIIPLPATGLEAWRDGLAKRCADTVVVAHFPPLSPSAPIMDSDLESWMARAETPLTSWAMALGGAALACADGGAIVAVVDAPPPLDAADLAPETAVAEGVVTLTRSLALSEGTRGVRANSVTTPARLVRRPPVLPDPPLAGYPGTIGEDVVGAVRLLLSADARHLSGRRIAADRGRAW